MFSVRLSICCYSPRLRWFAGGGWKHVAVPLKLNKSLKCDPPAYYLFFFLLFTEMIHL
jgi:hypothetical protein